MYPGPRKNPLHKKARAFSPATIDFPARLVYFSRERAGAHLSALSRAVQPTRAPSTPRSSLETTFYDSCVTFLPSRPSRSIKAPRGQFQHYYRDERVGRCRLEKGNVGKKNFEKAEARASSCVNISHEPGRRNSCGRRRRREISFACPARADA